MGCMTDGSAVAAQITFQPCLRLCLLVFVFVVVVVVVAAAVVAVVVVAVVALSGVFFR